MNRSTDDLRRAEDDGARARRENSTAVVPYADRAMPIDNRPFDVHAEFWEGYRAGLRADALRRNPYHDADEAWDRGAEAAALYQRTVVDMATSPPEAAEAEPDLLTRILHARCNITRRETIILGIALGLAIYWAWPLIRDIGSNDGQRLCSLVSGHLECVTWRGGRR
jgi:hypothetical protein